MKTSPERKKALVYKIIKTSVFVIILALAVYFGIKLRKTANTDLPSVSTTPVAVQLRTVPPVKPTINPKYIQNDIDG